MDLTMGGDTLLVGLRAQPALDIIDLAAVPRRTTALTLHADSAGDEEARTVLALAGNVALLWVGCAACPEQSRFLSVDLSTGVPRVREDAGPADRIVDWLDVVRRADRGHVFIMRIHSGDPTAITYDVSTDAFSPVFPIDGEGRLTGITAGGDVLLRGSNLLDATGRFIRNLYPPLFAPELHDMGTLAADGSYAVFTTPRGLPRVRLPDGRPLDLIATPVGPISVSIQPGGRELVASEFSTLMSIAIGPPIAPAVRPRMTMRAGRR